MTAAAGAPPVLDLVHLGLGPDGHTASLVPGIRCWLSRTATSRSPARTRDTCGMTLTFPLLDRARRVLWLVTGAEKAPMLARLRARDRAIPAGRVRDATRATIFCDRAAPATGRIAGSTVTEATMAAAQDLDLLCVNTIRTLSIDAVQAANSGHPGTPMALAPLAYTLWNRVLRFDPQDPIWPNRDRFVLSNGHASMLLWSVLHLTGTRRSMPTTRRWASPRCRSTTSGTSARSAARRRAIPNITWVSGVETTTGPLGQGIATSVGMAIGAALAGDAATTGRASTCSTTTSTRSAATAA